jgi:uncharacterized protein (DUF952 family)
MSRPLYHITTSAAWNSAGTDSHPQRYTPPGFAAEGFIHCSTAELLPLAANAYFHGRTDLILLHIDAERVLVPIKYENLAGGKDLYPHIYGPLERAAVLKATPFPPDSDGTFDHSAARSTAGTNDNTRDSH